MCNLQHVVMNSCKLVRSIYESCLFIVKKKTMQFSVYHHSTADIHRDNMAYRKKTISIVSSLSTIAPSTSSSMVLRRVNAPFFSPTLACGLMSWHSVCCASVCLSMHQSIHKLTFIATSSLKLPIQF